MTTGGAAAIAIVLTATPASATDNSTQADEIADTIAQAAPQGERVAQATEVNRSQAGFEHAGTDVTVPFGAGEPLAIETERFDLEITLPQGLNIKDGVVARDGTIVFEADGDDAHAAVQTLDDGSVRLQTVLESAHAPSTYTYDFGDDVVLNALDDGSVEVTQTVADGVLAVLGTIDAPWATDADGNSVRTHYTVEGSELTQHVDHTGSTVFPVAADPKFTQTWWNRTLYFNRSETAQVVAYGFGASFIAQYFGVPGRVISGALGGYSSAFAIYYANGHCGKLVSYPYPPAPVPQQYGGSEAGGYCA